MILNLNIIQFQLFFFIILQQIYNTLYIFFLCNIILINFINIKYKLKVASKYEYFIRFYIYFLYFNDKQY